MMVVIKTGLLLLCKYIMYLILNKPQILRDHNLYTIYVYKYIEIFYTYSHTHTYTPLKALILYTIK